MGIFDGIFSGAGNMVNSFLHPERGYQDAMAQFRKAWEEAQRYQKPYADAGTNQLPFLTGARDALANPAQLQGEWAKGYQTSPEAQDLMGRAREIGMNEASSMGLMGSSSALSNIQRGAGSIVAQDRQRYLDDLMKKYMASIGIGTDIYGTGATTAGQLGQNAMRFGENMGAGAYGARNAPGQMLGQMIGAGVGAYMGRSPGTGVA